MSTKTVDIFKNKIAKLKKDNESTNVPARNIETGDINTINIEPNNNKVLKKINIDNISPNPFQPRKIFKGIEELANSIKKKGLIQPITVIETSGDEYMLIAGERRLQSYKLLNKENGEFNKIDVVILDSNMTDSEKELLAALENIQRKDMTIIDTANLYASINKKGITYNEMVITLGESKTAISRYIKISTLPNNIKEILNKSYIKSTNKIELLTLLNGNIEKQEELANDIIKNETFIRIEKKIRKALIGEGDNKNKNTELILSLYEQIKPTSKIISKANYRKLDNDKRTKVDELLNTIIETQNKISELIE